MFQRTTGLPSKANVFLIERLRELTQAHAFFHDLKPLPFSSRQLLRV